MTQQEAPPVWRSRIVGHGEADPGELVENPANWRLHPSSQRAAVAGAVDTVGWVQSVIVNRTTGHLVDGHLRAALARERGETMIPVVYVELSDAEERLVLATLDPLGALAEQDGPALTALLDGVSVDDLALRALLDELGASATAPAEVMPPAEFPEYGEDIETEHTCPKCGYAWSGGA